MGHHKAPVDSASVYARHHAQDALRRSVAVSQRCNGNRAGCVRLTAHRQRIARWRHRPRSPRARGTRRRM
ncbi:hypothetical protein XAR_3959 [Xanthomonas citri pv. glycines str. 8ra]|nr:hypothetical protein XAR_3959 [Xanthomonas citri pv. glycines str. 8ra]